MRYNVEYSLALAAKAYIESAVDGADFATWPAVTWFDPMAIDEGNRVVCICQAFKGDATSPGNFEAQLEIGVRSNWAQPSLETDMANHFDRVNQVRDIFNAEQGTLIDSFNANCPAGLQVSYINQAREYQTEVNEGNYYSSLTLTVHCHATTE